MPFSFPGKYCPVKRKLYRDAHLFYLYDINENTDLGEGSYENATEAQKAAAVKVVKEKTLDGAGAEVDTGMHKVTIIAKLARSLYTMS